MAGRSQHAPECGDGLAPARAAARGSRHRRGVTPTAHDYGLLLPGQVSAEALVAVLGNRYSVPVAHVGAPVTVRVHHDRVCLWRDGMRLAEHRRAPDGARQRVVAPEHFAPLFPRKPRAQAMLYREVLLGLGGRAPAFLSALSQRQRAHLQEEVRAVYALYEEYGADNLLVAMALAEDAGSYSAAALAVLLAAPRPGPVPAPALHLPGVPPQAAVDRLLSVYETWGHVDVATSPAHPEVAS